LDKSGGRKRPKKNLEKNALDKPKRGGRKKKKRKKKKNPPPSEKNKGKPQVPLKLHCGEKRSRKGGAKENVTGRKGGKGQQGAHPTSPQGF